MIMPDEIRRKAESLYSEILLAWLEGLCLFPRTIRCNLKLPDSISEAAALLSALRSGSKAALGYGYSIEWEYRNLQRHGRNQVPTKVYFESAVDVLRLIGKLREFDAFTAAVGQIRSRHPKLEQWVRDNHLRVIKLANEVWGLLEVADCFLANPRPGLFARELPLAVDTKFIEQHENVLRDWLDVLLPPEAIKADEHHFARRYGLRYAEPLVHIRFVDPEIPQAAALPCHDLAVPLHSLAAWEIDASTIVIVENKTNLLTLPLLPGVLGIGGMGAGIADLRYVEWLQRRRLLYWGDVDAAGFGILSLLRSSFPKMESIFMDGGFIARWEGVIGACKKCQERKQLRNLIASESLAYERCISSDLWIEQERVPQWHVTQSLASAIQGD